MFSNHEFWFVARTKNCQELAVRDTLKRLNISHFLPTCIVTKQLKYRKKKVEVPIIHNLIFIHATKESACSLSNNFGLNVYYLIDQITHSLLVVPDKQMNYFMFVMDLAPDRVSLDNATFEPGDKVQVIKGEFSGIEGDLVYIASHSYVIIQIKSVLVLKIKIPKGYLKKI